MSALVPAVRGHMVKRVVSLGLLTVAVYAVAVSMGESLLMASVWALVSGVVTMQAAVALRGDE